MGVGFFIRKGKHSFETYCPKLFTVAFYVSQNLWCGRLWR